MRIKKLSLLPRQSFLAFVLVGSLFFSGLQALIPQTAEAAGEQYIFYYQKSDADEIKKALSNNVFNQSSAALKKTSVYAKGGEFGNRPVAFTLDSLSTSFSSSNNSLHYTTKYVCQTTDKVTIFVPLTISVKLPGNFDQVRMAMGATLLRPQSIVSEAGTLTNPGGTLYGGSYRLDYGDPRDPCPFNNAQSPGGKRISLFNYANMLPSARRAWPGLKSSAEIDVAQANPNSGQQQSQEPEDNLGCSSELSIGWAICAVVEAVGQFTDYVFSSIIQPMMENSPLSSESSDPFYKSWQSFRFIGNILLIGSMLAIVYSMARGDE